MIFYISYKNVSWEIGFRKTFIDLKDLSIALIGATVLTLASGITGFAFQTMDHWCHNAKFQELLQNDWPLRFPANRPVMAYYFGYYLVPAAFSKLAGHISQAAILIWTGLGVTLGLLWIYISLGHKWWAALLVLFVGDFPRLFKSIMAHLSIQLYRYEEIGMEHWSNLENLFWAPNQFIPSLILGGNAFPCDPPPTGLRPSLLSNGAGTLVGSFPRIGDRFDHRVAAGLSMDTMGYFFPGVFRTDHASLLRGDSGAGAIPVASAPARKWVDLGIPDRRG
ncbi:hypothetical protein [Dyadobacter sp. 676]|uniref:Uncharacterized protein n=1 Tax=Dyadobacter sp. 676 TaxID=3088362 RepID=A0AAU8FRR1_9BACT